MFALSPQITPLRVRETSVLESSSNTDDSLKSSEVSITPNSGINKSGPSDTPTLSVSVEQVVGDKVELKSEKACRYLCTGMLVQYDGPKNGF